MSFEYGGVCINGKLDVAMVPVTTFDDSQGTYITYEYFNEYDELPKPTHRKCGFIDIADKGGDYVCGIFGEIVNKKGYLSWPIEGEESVLKKNIYTSRTKKTLTIKIYTHTLLITSHYKQN